MLTIEHFKEIMKFEEWLMRLEYPDVPGKPKGWPANQDPPTVMTWYDQCEKENVHLKNWPEGTPDQCRDLPQLCPEIRARTRKKCRTWNSPLDFVYDNKLRDYNFRKFSSDDELVRKIRTGKGDETLWKYNELGEVIYVELLAGGSTPVVV